MPGAQIFAACTAGDGNSPSVRFKSKIGSRKHSVAPGEALRYKALVRNMDKGAAVEGLALTVQLPTTGVAYLGSKSSSAYVAHVVRGKAMYRKGNGLAAVVNVTTISPTVTWRGITLPPRKGMRFAIKSRVDPQEVYRGMPLTFSSWVYQELAVNGLPYCSRTFTNKTVVVK